MNVDPDWEPPNPPYKIPLPTPVHFFTVGKVRDDEDVSGWKFLGPCKARATCCGSRAELRFPDGGTKIVRIGGITGESVIITQPQPLGDIPIGTELWLLETEETDYAALVHGDTTPLPLFSPITNPVDYDFRRQIRKEVDSQLDVIPQSPERDLLLQGRSEYPACLADGSWVVFCVPCGHCVKYFHNTRSYVVESLAGNRVQANTLEGVLPHIGFNYRLRPPGGG